MPVGQPTSVIKSPPNPSTPGPTWATDVTDVILEIKDACNQAIPPSSLTFANSPLNLEENDINDIRSLNLKLDGTDGGTVTPANRSIYTKADGEFYLKDNIGQEIQLSVNGAIGSLGAKGFTGDYGEVGVPAAADYDAVSTTFEFQSNTVGPVFATVKASKHQHEEKALNIPAMSGDYHTSANLSLNTTTYAVDASAAATLIIPLPLKEGTVVSKISFDYKDNNGGGLVAVGLVKRTLGVTTLGSHFAVTTGTSLALTTVDDTTLDSGTLSPPFTVAANSQYTMSVSMATGDSIQNIAVYVDQ